MSKGNSGILSKFQTKLEYSTSGTIGDTNGYEVLKEVIVRFSPGAVNPNHTVRICGRMSNDTKWYEVGHIHGKGTDVFHIASWDYIMFECLVYDCLSTCTLIASGFFQDGMFMVDALKDMSSSLQDQLININSNICDLKDSINVITKELKDING